MVLEACGGYLGNPCYPPPSILSPLLPVLLAQPGNKTEQNNFRTSGNKAHKGQPADSPYISFGILEVWDSLRYITKAEVKIRRSNNSLLYLSLGALWGVPYSSGSVWPWGPIVQGSTVCNQNVHSWAPEILHWKCSLPR